MNLRLLLIASASASALLAGENPKGNPENAIGAAVRVTISLKPADWEKSLTAGIQSGERCSGCGGFHGGKSFETLLKRKQDSAQPGFLIAPDRVLIADPQLAAGEIAAITAADAAGATAARIEKIFIDQPAILLKLDQPFTAARPAAVKAGQTPACAFQLKENDELRIYADSQPLTAITEHLPDATPCLNLSGIMQFQSADGTVAGYTASQTRQPSAILSSEKADPANWRSITPAEFAAAEKRALEQAARSVLPVTLTYRAPPKDAAESRYSSNDSDALEAHTCGLFVSEKRLFIFAETPREHFSRLEGITVTLPGGATESARFIATLNAFNAFVAELETPHPESVLPVRAPSAADIGRLHILVETESASKAMLYNRTHSARLTGIDRGPRNLRTADFSGSDAGDLFFNLEGECLWVNLPVTYSDRSRRSSSGRSSNTYNLPATLLSGFAAPAEDEINTVLVPRPKEEEKQFVWLGFDIQPLKADLAQANGVAKQTRQGSFGAIINRIYPDSPAAKAGVEQGWILSRLRYPDQPAASEISISENFSRRYSSFASDSFFSDDADDDSSPPWPPFNTPFRLELTEAVAPGTTLEAEFFANGKQIVKRLTVETAPLWFGNAKIMTWKRAGLTLCNLTAEVREHFNLAPDAPGVVVKRVKPGTPAAIAGVKAYELITKVDGTPVRNVAAFTLAVRGKTSPVFAVSRAEKERVVTLNLSQKETATPGEEN